MQCPVAGAVRGGSGQHHRAAAAHVAAVAGAVLRSPDQPEPAAADGSQCGRPGSTGAAGVDHPAADSELVKAGRPATDPGLRTADSVAGDGQPAAAAKRQQLHQCGDQRERTQGGLQQVEPCPKREQPGVGSGCLRHQSVESRGLDPALGLPSHAVNHPELPAAKNYGSNPKTKAIAEHLRCHAADKAHFEQGQLQRR